MSAPAEGESSTRALLNSLAMIVVSEIGDKTFLLAAILAMRHPRAIVFAGAFGSLVVMSILSAAMGHLLPSMVPRAWTQAAAAALFLVFGWKMLKEGREMQEGDNSKMEEEMREAEEEIEGDSAKMDGGHAPIPLEDMEAGQAPPRPRSPPGAARTKGGALEGARNFFSLCFGPVFVQAFVLTFLAEWGDRSQIATIALGAAHNVYIVTLGTVFGHSLCTAAAVVGGRLIASKISVKRVTLAGAVLFLLFGFIYAYEALVAFGANPLPALTSSGLPARPDDPDALLTRR